MKSVPPGRAVRARCPPSTPRSTRVIPVRVL